MTKNIAIIDYKMGNLFSVNQACIYVGLNPIITNDKNQILNSEAVILPGVGSFGEAMKNLTNLDLIDVIKKVISESKPFMGICLGFQLLFTESEEFGLTKGLGVFEGKVKKFINGVNNGMSIKVPQIGWNQIFPYNEKKWNNSFLSETTYGEFMYFVHSFYVQTNDEQIKLAKTNYEGFEYCSSIEIDNLFASQFHPEKSANEGIKIYKKFAEKVE